MTPAIFAYETELRSDGLTRGHDMIGANQNIIWEKQGDVFKERSITEVQDGSFYFKIIFLRSETRLD